MKRLAGIRLPLLDDDRPAVRTACRLGLALASAAAGLGAVALLERLLLRPYYLPAFAAIIVPAVAAGMRYGALTTLVFGTGYAFLFLPPRLSFGVRNPHELTALAAYTLTGCFVAAIGGALRHAYAQVRDQLVLLHTIQEQREDLLRALTHDIRSPLSVITMNARLLARAGEGDPALRRRALLIEGSAATVSAMLRDLVDAATLESGQVSLQREPVDLAALAAGLLERLAGTLPVERVRLAVPPGLPRLWADPQRLERVLVNLVGNALKYSPPETEVTLGASAQDGRVVISVADRGPGIPPQDLAHIFEKYYRAREAQSQDGLGLGLYIARLLVEAHGGRIWPETTPGAGTTFHVALPAVPAGPAAAGTAAGRERASARGS